MVAGEGFEPRRRPTLLPLERRRCRRCDHAAAAVKEDDSASLADLQASEKLGESVELYHHRDDASKIAIYDHRRRRDDGGPIAVREMRDRAPDRAIIGDGALIPRLCRRLIIALRELTSMKHYIAWFR